MPLDWLFGALALLLVAGDVFWITRRPAPAASLANGGGSPRTRALGGANG